MPPAGWSVPLLRSLLTWLTWAPVLSLCACTSAPHPVAAQAEAGNALAPEADTTADIPPAPPLLAPDQPIGEMLLVVRTGPTEADASDGVFSLCLAPDRCFALDDDKVDDLEPGSVDQFRRPAPNLTKATIDRVELRAEPGFTDDWRPECVAVVADGELLFCQDGLQVPLHPDATATWQAPNPTTKACAGCWPQGALALGPMVGHTTPTSIKVWLRTASSQPVQVEVSADPAFPQPKVSEVAVPLQADDFARVFEVGGLLPDQQVHYRVRVAGQVAWTSPEPIRTAPAAGDQATWVFGSCINFPHKPVFQAIAQLQPDVLLLVGDTVYANTTDVDHLRWHYRRLHGDPLFAPVAARTPTWAIWDDHDFTGNNSDGTAPGKELSLQVFQQQWANGSYGSDGVPGLWSTLRWGEVEAFLLDGRYYRKVDGMLGTVQRKWLIDRLAASTATFKLLVSGSRWTQQGSADSWASFPAEREAILAEVFARKINGVVLLSGDIHRSEVRRIVEDSPGKYPIYEFTSSPLANSTTTCKPADPELLFCYSGNSFGVLRFDTGQSPAQLVHEVRDQAGQVLFALTLASTDLVVD